MTISVAQQVHSVVLQVHLSVYLVKTVSSLMLGHASVSLVRHRDWRRQRTVSRLVHLTTTIVRSYNSVLVVVCS